MKLGPCFKGSRSRRFGSFARVAFRKLAILDAAGRLNDLLLVPPGEVLLEEFLRPMGISQYRLATAIDVPGSRINAIVKGRRAITADTDLRLCRFFGLSEGVWLRMQASHDLKQAKQALESVLPTIQPVGCGPV